MQGDLLRMEAISQNIANASTPGYRREVPVARPFGELMRASDAGNAPKTGGELAAPEVHGVLDGTVGPMKLTGRPFDVALMGNGYLEVVTKDGLAYTRSGNLQLDPAGRLVNEAGLPVSGVNGEIILNGAVASIAANGEISQQGRVVAQIKVVEFDDPRAMVRLPNGLLQPADKTASGKEVKAALRVGYLEGSNVQPLREMLAMMETMRRFEASQKLFQGYDEVMRSAIGKLLGQ
jgi:flagellar basal-body rod protein FlgG